MLFMEQRHDETNRYCSSLVRSSCSWEMFDSGCGVGHGDDRFRDQGPSSEVVDLFGSKKMVSDLNSGLSKKTFVFGLKVWVLIGIIVGLFIIIILMVLSICLTLRKKSRRVNGKLPLRHVLSVTEEIKKSELIKFQQIIIHKMVLL
ncbi:Serine/threonine-protein kinase [Spatholobus suberectus]|nr:Serine/threonine-protein kinase [Spatholobus suberectus]